MVTLKKVWSIIIRIILSPRVKALAWSCVTMGLTILASLVADKSNILHLNVDQVVFWGLVLNQITKALSNMSQGKDHGFIAAK